MAHLGMYSVQRKLCIGGMIATLVAGTVVAHVVFASSSRYPVLHLRIDTALAPPSGRVIGGGVEDVWVDWHAGKAFSRSLVPGELTTSDHWYRRLDDRIQTWSLQVDGQIISDGGQSPWGDVVLQRSAGGIKALRQRYAALLPRRRQRMVGAPVVAVSTAADLFPAPLPGPMMQQGTTVWLDPRSMLPQTVIRRLLPYLGGSREIEICHVRVLNEEPNTALPPDFTGPLVTSPWSRLRALFSDALNHVHL